MSVASSARCAIVVEELTRYFGEFVAVDHVSFSVNEGEIFGWLGPNGAGKTTTIRMLLGLIKPTSGKASVLGYDPAKEAKVMQAVVGYMSQQFTLYNELTAREQHPLLRPGLRALFGEIETERG